MKIAVVGAGAMGSLFGGRLSRVTDVWLLDTWEEHVRALQEGGLHLIEPEGEEVIKVKATTNLEEIPKDIDLAIIFVKSHQTEMAARMAGHFLKRDGIALTLQNGLGNLKVIASVLGENRALQGVTSEGATLLGPGKVRHAGRGPTYLSTRPDISKQVEEIADLFRKAGFEVHISPELDSLIWGKLVINVGINALTAILRVPNGYLAEIEPARELMGQAVAEAVEVARAKGIKLPYEDPQERVKEVCRATAANRSSMLQDVLRGARTEIDVINGAVVKEGERLGVPTPINRTLVALVKAIEESYPVRI
ncbi:MAG TPA: 2-dehydropantoate 2-reductase [Chloroflexi bacterium]|nr:2-dehydropantoate 2-reductase [Chloroflexota bacterium]